MDTPHIHRPTWRKPLFSSTFFSSLFFNSILCAVPLMGLSGLLNTTTTAAIASTTKTAKEDKSVLVIHSYNPEYPWTLAQKEGIDQGFQNEEQDVTVYHEFLDAKRYPDLHYQAAFLDYVKNKYEDTPLSVMMVSDDPGLNLILAKREAYFPTLPIVFLGINQSPENLLNQPSLTGVFEANSNVETVIEAARQTGSSKVIVITDDSSTSQGNLRRLESGLMNYKSAPTLIEVKDVVTSEVESRLGGYADHLPIFLIGQFREGSETGALRQFWQGAKLLRSQLPNPLYTNSRLVVEHSTVGGKVLDGNGFVAPMRKGRTTPSEPSLRGLVKVSTDIAIRLSNLNHAVQDKTLDLQLVYLLGHFTR